MFDCHVHSSFSGDSQMPAEIACKTAIEKGLSGIAFTDHLDFDYNNDDEFIDIDFNVYSDFMDKLKSTYNRSNFKVLKGIEIGIQPHIVKKTMSVVNGYNFDFVLASVHCIDGIDPYVKGFYDGKSKQSIYERYLQEILIMIKSIDDYDIVGHLEYITRYSNYTDRSMKYIDHKETFDAIFTHLIGVNKGFEVNTGSFRDKPNIKAIEFDIALLKRYKELGGEIITIGSDAHDSEYLAYKFPYFKEMLLEAGFKYTTHFEERMPIFDKI